MRPDTSSRRRATAPLAHRIADDSTAAEIAAACAAIWLEVHAALSPIIGPRGVAALGQRSLHLASVEHPWLAARQPGGPAGLDAALLVALLAQASSNDEAAAAGSSFLQTFRALLSSLIGSSLTERLLRSVWGPPDTALNSPTAQDPTP
ncbi:MAG: hypothetical protein V4795_14895 [Pseudomonadota bacterium]